MVIVVCGGTPTSYVVDDDNDDDDVFCGGLLLARETYLLSFPMHLMQTSVCQFWFLVRTLEYTSSLVYTTDLFFKTSFMEIC